MYALLIFWRFPREPRGLSIDLAGLMALWLPFLLPHSSHPSSVLLLGGLSRANSM